MAEDTVSDAEDVEQTASTDTDEVLLLVFVALGLVFILAFVFDYKQLANLGVGEISSFLTPVQDLFNGIGNLITGLFNGLAKDVSSGIYVIMITMHIDPSRGTALIRIAAVRLHIIPAVV